MAFYLYLAGFVLKIHYAKEDRMFVSDIVRRIRRYYHTTDTISASQSQQVDCHIRLLHTDVVPLNLHRGAHFSLLFIQKNQKIFETYSHISIVEFSLLLLRILRKLLQKDSGFLLHASGNVINDKAVLFTGPSGAGKSTISRLLASKYPSLADDTVVLRKVAQTYYAFPSPLLQKDPPKPLAQSMLPVSKIFFLRKSRLCSTHKIEDTSIIFKTMLQQMWVEKDNITQNASQIERFTTSFHSFYTLNFPKNKRIVQEFFV